MSMCIPLKTVCCATTIALVLSPGVAEAAEPGEGDRPDTVGGAPASEPEDQPRKRRGGDPRTSRDLRADAAEAVIRELGRDRAEEPSRTKEPSRTEEPDTTKSPDGDEASGAQHGRATATQSTKHHKKVQVKKGREKSRHGKAGKKQLLASMQKATRKRRHKMIRKWQRTADKAVDYARRQKGRPYVWGGNGRRGFDCSGLVQQAWDHAGVDIPRVTYQQYRRIDRKVKRGRLRPGDLIFFNGKSHVGIYIGRDRFIHSPRPGRVVSTDRLRGYYSRNYVGAVRPGWKPLPKIPKRLPMK